MIEPFSNIKVMDKNMEGHPQAGIQKVPAWSAVFSMTLGVFSLVTAEFLPASLLTPMSESLQVSEGVAGQAVTMTALFALLAGLLVGVVTRSYDRRKVLLCFTVLLIISNLLVAFATGLTMVLFARMLLGIGIGGFWSMATVTTMRLVPGPLVPKALSVVFSGVSIATVMAAPLGSFLGGLIGWQNVFLLITVVAVATLIWQYRALPSMVPKDSAKLSTLFKLLARPVVSIGMLSIMMVFTGHFAFFTYLRPFLETVTHVDVNQLSLVLLGFGVANFIGTSLIGFILEKNLRLVLMAVPFLMSVVAVALVVSGTNMVIASCLVALWGFLFGAVPVAWSTWIARAVPDEAESAGGLLVAVIQFAIMMGAALGGYAFHFIGMNGLYLCSAIVLLIAAILINRKMQKI